jgi:hypothetical protein
MSTTSVPAIHHDKIVVNNILFYQSAITEFLVWENNSAADIYG